MDTYFVQKILKNCSDLSIDSPELIDSWVDLQTELQLNSERANFLRALKLKQESSILQIGCSCGILSRYFADQGHRVVVVDQDLNRLKTARLRCKDIKNVTYHSKKDEIQSILAENYDLILINRFLENLSGNQTTNPTSVNQVLAHQSVQFIAQQLTRLTSVLNQDGCFVIPAANRLGLKYWLGSKEESGEGQYIGLQNLTSDLSSSQSFSRKEWELICKESGIFQHRFLYPYPDHLLTEMILSEEFIVKDPFSHSLLYRIRSRDYMDPGWLPDHDEYLYWKSLHQRGYLTDFSNSFLLIGGNTPKSIDTIFPYDFIKLSKSKQQKRYQTITYKKSGEGIIEKEIISTHTDESTPISQLFHTPESSDYLQGNLLASLWIDSLISRQGYEEFVSLLRVYYQYINKQLQEVDHTGRFVDLLPFNIIVDDQGNYQSFDQEWQSSNELGTEFVLFRALLWFCFAHDTVIAKKMSKEKVTNIADFISFFFKQLSIPTPPERLSREYPELEAKIQQIISDSQGISQVQSLLYQPFQYCVTTRHSTLFDTQLFWVTEEESLSSINSKKVKGHIGPKRQTLFFTLPKHVSSLTTLRFDAADKPGFFHLYRMTMKQKKSASAEPVIIWEKKGAEEINSSVILDNVNYCSGVMGNVFLATSENPQVIVEFPKEITNMTTDGHLVFEVEIDWPQSTDYLTAVEEINKQNQMLNPLFTQNVAYKNHIINLGKHIATLEYKLDLVRKSGLGKLFKSFRV